MKCKSKNCGKSVSSAKRKICLYLILLFLFFVIPSAFAEEEGMTRIDDLQKEDLSQDANEALREYYGQVFGIVGPNSRFNNIAANEDIAVINVTIDGRDRRILTKLARGVILPRVAEELLATKISVNNLTVLENLKIFASWIFPKESSYGKRNFYGEESSLPVYVDEGVSRLSDGRANISINPVLRDMISGYNVYLSSEGMTRGLYIAEKSSSYFIVKSVSPESNVKFSWMLRGTKKGFATRLESEYAKELGIEIKAEINYENEIAFVKIGGLDAIINLAANIAKQKNVSNDSELNANISNQPQGQTVNMITGNLVDEFGLETDLGRILSNASSQSLAEEEIGSESASAAGNSETQNITNESIEILGDATSNETNAMVQQKDALNFILYSTDEMHIIEQVAVVTGLDEDNVKSLITFVYLEPENFQDEFIPEGTEGIERVNGSVIIRLG